MWLFRVFYDKREDCLINTFTVRELAGESPAVFAIRYDDQGRGDVMSSKCFVEADGVGYLDGGVILTADDDTGRSIRCDLFVARPVGTLSAGGILTEQLAA